MARNVLVVTTSAPDEADLARELRGLIDEGARVRVVAPAAKLSWLDWLTSDEDRARAEARRAADRTAEAIGGEADVRIDRTSHDSDVAQAVEDALRSFPADEIVVLTRPDEDASWFEEEAVRAAFERFGVPVKHVELPED
jgi:UDP-N-acetylmuramyl tripeptide synthase